MLALAFLLGTALLIGFLIRPRFAGVLLAYVGLNVGYSLGLKRAVILDVMLLALGFVLRAVGGAGRHPCHGVALAVGVHAGAGGLRRARQTAARTDASAVRSRRAHRPSLEGYSEQLLDLMMAIAGGAAIVAYALYTMAHATIERFGGSQLVLTIPFVIYGVFRYLFLAHRRQEDGDPASLLLTDLPSLINVVLWAALACTLIYAPVAWFAV